MTQNGNIEDKKDFTNKQMIIIGAALISATFTLTTIYNRFLFVEEHMQTMDDQNIERFETIERRIDNIKNRQKETDEKQNNRLYKLEQPDSDHKYE